MSALQLQTCERLIHAMGPMIYNPTQVERVMNYITSLQADAPCQFNHEEMTNILASGIAQTRQGVGVSHEELKKVTTSWL
ncbi:MAG: hypothetical protein MJZ79_04805 [Paludibacteraceae bacterium]|nr:hypothetical protein [Paludibacteraceae bacterium]